MKYFTEDKYQGNMNNVKGDHNSARLRNIPEYYLSDFFTVQKCYVRNSGIIPFGLQELITVDPDVTSLQYSRQQKSTDL